MKKIHQQGFSLTELVVVMAIIGIITMIAVPMFGNYSTTAYGAQAVNNIYTLEIALSDYYAENGTYFAGTYDATGVKNLQTGALAWQPGESDADQQYSYTVTGGASCGGNIAQCYDITATGLGRDVPTDQQVFKPSNGPVVYQTAP